MLTPTWSIASNTSSLDLTFADVGQYQVEIEYIDSSLNYSNPAYLSLSIQKTLVSKNLVLW